MSGQVGQRENEAALTTFQTTLIKPHKCLINHLKQTFPCSCFFFLRVYMKAKTVSIFLCLSIGLILLSLVKLTNSTWVCIWSLDPGKPAGNDARLSPRTTTTAGPSAGQDENSYWCQEHSAVSHSPSQCQRPRGVHKHSVSKQILALPHLQHIPLRYICQPLLK